MITPYTLEEHEKLFNKFDKRKEEANIYIYIRNDWNYTKNKHCNK